MGNIDKYLIQYQTILNFEQPSQRHVHALRQWLKNTDSITDTAMNYLDRDEPDGEPTVPCAGPSDDFIDLMTLNSDADSWFGRVLRHSFLKYFFMVCKTDCKNRVWTY